MVPYLGAVRRPLKLRSDDVGCSEEYSDYSAGVRTQELEELCDGFDVHVKIQSSCPSPLSII